MIIARNQSGRVSSATGRSFTPRRSLDELYKEGKRLRDKCPRQSHAAWQPKANRPDPLSLLVQSSKGRIPQLIPIRYGRMLQTPFTFYRVPRRSNWRRIWPALPTTGIRVQACGDCHLVNFGGFRHAGMPADLRHQRLRRDAAGPREWDLARLAASFVIACRNNGFSDTVARQTVPSPSAFSYKERLWPSSAEMDALDVWYARIDLNAILLAHRGPGQPASASMRSLKRPRPTKAGCPRTFSQAGGDRRRQLVQLIKEASATGLPLARRDYSRGFESLKISKRFAAIASRCRTIASVLLDRYRS